MSEENKLYLDLARDTVQRFESLHSFYKNLLYQASPEEMFQAIFAYIRESMAVKWIAIWEFDIPAHLAKVVAVADPWQGELVPGFRVDFDDLRGITNLRRNRINLVEDIMGDATPPAVDQSLKKAGIRSYVSVPFHFGGELIGCLTLGSEDALAFSSKLVEISQQIADDIALPIHLLRYYTNAKTNRLVLETLHQASLSFSQNIDEDLILEILLEHLIKLIPSSRIWILAVEDETKLALWGTREAGTGGARRGSRKVHINLQGNNILRRIVANRESILIPNVKTYPGWRDFPGSIGQGSWIGIPLLVGGNAFGICSIENSSPMSMVKEHQGIAEVLITQAGMALENAQLFEDLRRRLKLLSILHQAWPGLQKIHTRQSLADEMMMILDAAVDCDDALILLIDESRGRLVPFTYKSVKGEEVSEIDSSFDPNVFDFRIGRGITGWVAQTGESLRIADVLKEPRYLEIHETTRSELCVPLRLGEQILGVINIESARVNAFTELDQDILETIAGQFSVAIQNLRLIERGRRQVEVVEQNVAFRTSQLEQQYRRQSALADIELAVNEPHELEVVLDRIAKVTTKLLPATGGASVILWDPQSETYYVGSTSVPGLEASKTTHQIRRQGGATRWIIENRQSLIVPDVQEDPFGGSRLETAFFNQAYAGIPLIAGYEVLGVLYALDKEPRDYSQEDLDFLYALANRAALAISKVRLFESERMQRRLADTLRAASLDLTQSLDLDTVMDTLLIHLKQLVPFDTASVLLVQGNSQVVIQATKGYDQFTDPDRLASTTFDVRANPLFSKILMTQKSILIPDTDAHLGWDRKSGTENIRNWMGVPMVAGGNVIGIYSIDKSIPGFFTDDHLRATEALAAQGAVAIQNAQLFRHVQRLAVTDALTGTFNRRHFFELAEREFSRANRFERPIAAIMLDIDHFKKVNDTYGHAVGDEVLRVLAGRCLESIRDIDILGRYGGEEFVILLPETDVQATYHVAERLRLSMEKEPVLVDGVSLPVTISLGIASVSADTQNLDSLINRADAAMYAAKQAGRNCVMVS